MNLLEIVDKRNEKLKELEDFASKFELEKRKMNEDEESDFSKIKNEVENLNKQIDDIKEADNKAIRTNESIQKNNNKNMNETKFNLLKTIRSFSPNFFPGESISEEIHTLLNAGKESFRKAGLESLGQITLPTGSEYRDILAGTATAGQEIIQTNVLPLVLQFRAKTVLGQAGATFYSNLVGNVQIPIYNNSTVQWGSEVSANASGSTGAFSDIILSPHRLSSYIDISKQFLVQDSIDAEATLLQDLQNAILVAVENTAFSQLVGSASANPQGMFYNLTGNTTSFTSATTGTTSFAKLINLKGVVDTNNSLTGNLAYITNPSESAIMETTPVNAAGGSVMSMNAGKINGYPVLSTSNVGTYGAYNLVAFGNWSDFVIGQFGGMDLLVDPYTQANLGKVRIVINTYWDFKVKKQKSFSYSYMG